MAAHQAATADRTQRALTFRPGTKNPSAIEPDTPDLGLWLARLAATFGVRDLDAQCHLVTQLGGVFWRGEPTGNANAAVALIGELAPGSGVEAMLAVQMVAVHNTALEQLRRAMLPDQPSVIVDSTTHRATRLLRLFADQAAALQRLRAGRGGVAQPPSTTQTLRVEFVRADTPGQDSADSPATLPWLSTGEAHDDA